MLVKALETIYYGESRRKPAEFDEDGNQTRKADIFMLRERKGKGKDGKPITLSVQHQYNAIKDKVAIVKVDKSDIVAVRKAKLEVIKVQNFEKEQEEIDEMDAAIAIAETQDADPTIDEILAQQKAEMEIAESEANDEINSDEFGPKSQEELDLEAETASSTDGTGNTEVLS